jgi:hypothetical protein
MPRRPTTRPDYKTAALDFIRRHGREEARRIADAEIFQAVNDVTYPFGRIGLYAAVRDLLAEAVA